MSETTGSDLLAMCGETLQLCVQNTKKADEIKVIVLAPSDSDELKFIDTNFPRHKLRSYLAEQIHTGFSGLCACVFADRRGGSLIAVIEGFDTERKTSARMSQVLNVNFMGRVKGGGTVEFHGDAEALDS